MLGAWARAHLCSVTSSKEPSVRSVTQRCLQTERTGERVWQLLSAALLCRSQRCQRFRMRRFTFTRAGTLDLSCVTVLLFVRNSPSLLVEVSWSNLSGAVHELSRTLSIKESLHLCMKLLRKRPECDTKHPLVTSGLSVSPSRLHVVLSSALS